MNDLRIRRRRRLVQCAFAGVLLTALAAPVLASSGDGLPNDGQWLLDASRQGATVQFTLRASSSSATHHDDFEMTNPMRLSALTGLTSDQLNSVGTHVSFRLIRDAGTFACDGWVAHLKGGGTFNFAASPSFAAGLANRGIGAPTGDQSLRLALGDIGLGYIDELKADGYARPSIDDLVRMGDHGVDAAFLKDMSGFGYRLQNVDALVRLRDHGVDGDYLRGLAALGYKNIGAEDAVRFRDHGVDAGFIRGMQKDGYTGLSIENLVRLRDHGVDTDFVDEMRSAGYSNISADDLVRLRDHGVDGAYVKKLASHGYAHLSVADLIRLRDSGI